MPQAWRFFGGQAPVDRRRRQSHKATSADRKKFEPPDMLSPLAAALWLFQVDIAVLDFHDSS
ncbi:hypothetical protein NXZ69_15665, partial [Xanthomonas hortorum pv. pelargonii]|uniref:hypothetical protein n=1 Tax=Xanthomonas hortorum TaxID=56454 RepID=UPI0021C91BAE